jgi:hypothetical protein
MLRRVRQPCVPFPSFLRRPRTDHTTIRTSSRSWRSPSSRACSPTAPLADDRIRFLDVYGIDTVGSVDIALDAERS